LRVGRRETRWGTGDIGVSDANAGSWRLPGTGARDATALGAASTVRDAKGGNRTRAFHVRSIRNLHHQRSVEPLVAANRIEKKFTRGALHGAPQGANPLRFALPSVSGFRLVPSDRPRALGPRADRREPRDPGLPFRLPPGKLKMRRASDNKKPSGAAGSGGSV
jgi:hypothetical protein